jgi:hypothetical protein
MTNSNWLDLGLAAINQSAPLSQTLAMRDLTEAEAKIALERAYQAALRSRVADVRRVLLEALALEERNPLQAAGAVRSIQLQVEASHLSPALFNELHDRQTVGQLLRDIQLQSQRLREQLSSTDRATAESAAQAQFWFGELTYALQHHALYQRYRTATQFVEKEQDQQRLGARLYRDLIWVLLTLLFLMACPLLMNGFWSLIPTSLSMLTPLYLLSLFLSVVVVLVGSPFYQYRVVRHRRAFREAKALCEQVQSELNVERLDRVAGTYTGEEEMRRAYAAAQQMLAGFYGR